MTIEQLAAANQRILADMEARAAREEELEEELRLARRARHQSLQEFLQGLASTMPAPPADADTNATWTDVEQHRAELRSNVWEGCLRSERLTRLGGRRLEDFDPDHARVGSRYIDALGPDCLRQNLLLVGDVGTGKTSFAITLGARAMAAGLTVRLISHARYLTGLQPGKQPGGRSYDATVSLYREATDLLILDDFGADMESGASDFAARETVQLLGARLNSGQATIITTNLSSDEVTDILGKRSYSRIGGASFVVHFEGPDLRQPPVW